MKQLNKPPIDRNKKLRALILAMIIVIAAIALLARGEQIDDLLESYGLDLDQLLSFFIDTPPERLEVHFIDVGQGDSILIRAGENTMLVDCGTNDSEEILRAYLLSQRIDTVDCMVLTHSHEDHIGGADMVVKSFPVGRILLPEAVTASVPLNKLLDAAEKKDVPIYSPEVGKTYTIGELRFTVLAPNSDAAGNNSSIVLRLDYGERSFLLTGDAEVESEQEMLAKFGETELKSDVLKLGHHGSSTSTGKKFFEAVDPEWAVICCGKDNPYGHPHREIRSLLEKSGIPKDHILRTDKDGSIVFKTDGKELKLAS